MRGSIGPEILHTQGFFRDIVGTLGFIAILGAIIWGFVNLPWWLVVLSFLGISFFLVPVVFGNRERLPLLIAAQPLFDIVCIVLVAILWLAGPFR